MPATHQKREAEIEDQKRHYRQKRNGSYPNDHGFPVEPAIQFALIAEGILEGELSRVLASISHDRRQSVAHQQRRCL